MSNLKSAIYENGVLRLDEPLEFPEGTRVSFVLTTPVPVMGPPRDAFDRRLDEAKTMKEVFEIMNEMPPEGDPSYDLEAALRENRGISLRVPFLDRPTIDQRP